MIYSQDEVSDGQYLLIEQCIMYTEADAPAVDNSNGIYGDGMYEVG